MLGFRDVAQVPGIEAMEAVCRAGLVPGWRHYFLGGSSDVLQRLVHNLQQRMPGLRIAGSESPPFRPLMPAERGAIRARIRQSGTDIVWIGLGTPKQELWMHAEAPYLPGTIAMGVGAAFDVHAGKVARAPAWLRRIGLEWLYRALSEPRRLLGRYAVTVPNFLFLMLQMGVGRLVARGTGWGGRVARR
jgi:N-acetylglucosaminyldiphosphoundecaprenol N-acetyl-beta-D-mannosaminyltransferase